MMLNCTAFLSTPHLVAQSNDQRPRLVRLLYGRRQASIIARRPRPLNLLKTDAVAALSQYKLEIVK